jgi:hypothetical protein
MANFLASSAIRVIRVRTFSISAYDLNRRSLRSFTCEIPRTIYEIRRQEMTYGSGVREEWERQEWAADVHDPINQVVRQESVIVI